MLNRRDFAKFLGIASGAAAAGTLPRIEPEADVFFEGEEPIVPLRPKTYNTLGMTQSCSVFNFVSE